MDIGIYLNTIQQEIKLIVKTLTGFGGKPNMIQMGMKFILKILVELLLTTDQKKLSLLWMR
jgi:hypothetical protein